MNVKLLNIALDLSDQLDRAATTGEIVAAIYTRLEQARDVGYYIGYEDGTEDADLALDHAFDVGLDLADEDDEVREPRDNAHVEGEALINPETGAPYYTAADFAGTGGGVWNG